MMLRYWRMFILSLRLKSMIPVKIYCPARVRLQRGSKLILGSRWVIGASGQGQPVVSSQTVNVWVGKGAVLQLGKGFNVGPGTNMIIKNNALCKIGNNTYITSDTHLEALNEVTIGNNCAISWGVTIIDDDHHIIKIENKSFNPSGKITIGDHVWIGCNVTILKNTQIGQNSVVAAGSVVKGYFPEGSLIAGNPARVVKNNVTWE